MDSRLFESTRSSSCPGSNTFTIVEGSWPPEMLHRRLLVVASFDRVAYAVLLSFSISVLRSRLSSEDPTRHDRHCAASIYTTTLAPKAYPIQILFLSQPKPLSYHHPSSIPNRPFSPSIFATHPSAASFHSAPTSSLLATAPETTTTTLSFHSHRQPSKISLLPQQRLHKRNPGLGAAYLLDEARPQGRASSLRRLPPSAFGTQPKPGRVWTRTNDCSFDICLTASSLLIHANTHTNTAMETPLNYKLSSVISHHGLDGGGHYIISTEGPGGVFIINDHITLHDEVRPDHHLRKNPQPQNLSVEFKLPTAGNNRPNLPKKAKAAEARKYSLRRKKWAEGQGAGLHNSDDDQQPPSNCQGALRCTSGCTSLARTANLVQCAYVYLRMYLGLRKPNR